MPRCARDKDTFGTFYVIQISNPRGVLFRDDADRSYFLEVLKKAQQKYEFKLYGYCLLSSNSYHLILDVNGGDLSSIMKSINIRYAMYAKCEYPIFKDRYKSERLCTPKDIIDKVESINHKSASEYNSYCHYDSSSPIQLDFIASIEDDNERDVIKASECGCVKCVETISEAAAYIEVLTKEAGVEFSEILRDKVLRNKLIKRMRRQSVLSLKEIGILFGGLSESAISKILNS